MIKQIPTTLILLFFVLELSYSQQKFCSFKLAVNKNLRSSDCGISVCDDSLSLYANYPITDIPMKTVNIRWVLFSDDDGTEGTEPSTVENYTDVLNDLFKPYKFQFKINEIVSYKNTIVNHAVRDDWEINVDYYAPYVKNQDKVANLFVTKEFGFWDETAFATFPYDIPLFDYITFPERKGVIVLNQRVIDPEYESYQIVLPHEFGHLFGLLHVDQHNDCNNICNEIIQSSGDSTAVDPYTTGDLIADTYPHPSHNELPSIWDSCKLILDSIIIDDCTGYEFYKPQLHMTNFMGLFRSCDKLFTLEQTLKMHCFIESNYPGYYEEKDSGITTEVNQEPFLFPNPTNGKIYMIDSSQFAIDQIQIYDLSGRVVKDERLNNLEDIDLKFLVNGCYFIAVYESSNRKGIQKIILQHD